MVRCHVVSQSWISLFPQHVVHFLRCSKWYLYVWSWLNQLVIPACRPISFYRENEVKFHGLWDFLFHHSVCLVLEYLLQLGQERKRDWKIRNRRNTNDYLEMFKSDCYSLWCLCLFILTYPISTHCLLLPFESNPATWNIPKALGSSLEVKRAAMGHPGMTPLQSRWLPSPHTATDIVLVFVPGWSSCHAMG